MKERVKSIRYPIAIDAGLGRLALETDYDAHVRQLIMQVLLTNPGERVNRPDFGCGLQRMVFTPNGEAAASLTQVTIIQALDKWLGTLIDVEAVEVTAADEVLEVHIAYIVKARRTRHVLNLEIGI